MHLKESVAGRGGACYTLQCLVQFMLCCSPGIKPWVMKCVFSCCVCEWIPKIPQVGCLLKIIMLYKVVLTFKYVKEIISCDHSNESYCVVLSSVVPMVVQFIMRS